MRLAIVSNEFPPVKSSGSFQVFDLAKGFAAAGFEIIIITATPGSAAPYQVENIGLIKILRFPAFRSKDVPPVRRAISEILTPLRLAWCLWRYKPIEHRIDGVIWYSPTIFLGWVIHVLKRRFNCKGYLILRDIFPDWAVHTGLMKKGPAYFLFKQFEYYQYRLADFIGVQAESNVTYLARWGKSGRRTIEVLNNWLSHSGIQRSSLQLKYSKLANKKVFIYAGNMGAAQGMHLLFELAFCLRNNNEVGFLFIGRGRDFIKYRNNIKYSGLDNILFEDFIPSDQMPDLYSQCFAGLISLNINHRTHNIPGKFLSYMASGLPVVGCVNPGNDLISIVSRCRVGVLISDGRLESLVGEVEFLSQCSSEELSIIRENCLTLSRSMFSTEAAVRQISERFITARY